MLTESDICSSLQVLTSVGNTEVDDSGVGDAGVDVAVALLLGVEVALATSLNAVSIGVGD